MFLYVSWMLLSTSSAAAGTLGELPLRSAKEVGFTQHWGVLSERERLAKRKEGACEKHQRWTQGACSSTLGRNFCFAFAAGWKWSFPGEGPAYAAWQEQRTREILSLYHHQERLDNWVQFTAARVLRNFTVLGFDVVDAPPDLHARLKVPPNAES